MVSVTALRDEKDGVLGYLLIGTDNSARKKAEEEQRRQERALRQSEMQFEVFANEIPQLCWIANSDGTIIWYNQRWYDYTGTTLEEMRGWGWKSVHDPAELPRVMEAWTASIETGCPFESVFPLRGADGAFRTFLTRVVPIKDADGNTLRWFGTNVDITERKLAEDALREQADLLDLSHDSIMVRDLSGKIRFWSHGAELMYSYSKALAKGKITHELLHTVFPQSLAHIDAELLRNGRWEGELEHTTGDGRQILVASRWVLQENRSGTPVSVMEINNEVTERKHIEEELRRSHEKLRLLVEGVKDYAIVMLDPNGTIATWTEAAETIKGYHAEDIIGRHYSTFFLPTRLRRYSPSSTSILLSREEVLKNKVGGYAKTGPVSSPRLYSRHCVTSMVSCAVLVK